MQHLLDVAERSGIAAQNIPHHGRAVADVARDVVDEGRRRQRLKDLVETLRKDERVAVHWATLDALLREDVAPQKV